MENQLDPFACPALGGLFSVSELYGRTAGGVKIFRALPSRRRPLANEVQAPPEVPVLPHLSPLLVQSFH